MFHSPLFSADQIDFCESIYPEMEGKSTNGIYAALLDFRENCRYIYKKLIVTGELFN
jgi:hypothetical protein